MAIRVLFSIHCCSPLTLSPFTTIKFPIFFSCHYRFILPNCLPCLQRTSIPNIRYLTVNYIQPSLLQLQIPSGDKSVPRPAIRVACNEPRVSPNFERSICLCYGDLDASATNLAYKGSTSSSRNSPINRPDCSGETKASF
jgi:hypothetical protein